MDDHNLSKLNKAFRVLGCILVVISGITVIVGLGRRGLGYYWLLVAPLFGIAFYMLAPRSWRITRVLISWFPVANELIHRQEQVDHNIAVVEKMGYTLKFYELCDIDQVEGLRNRLINSLPDLNTEAGRLENCARHAADHLKASKPNLHYRLLMLLYQDHHSSPPIVLWTEEKTNLIPGLAELLRTSIHLQSRQYKVSYENEDLERFLLPLQVFTLAGVKKEIEGLNELWSVIRDYLLFLIKHEVASERQLLTPGEVLDRLKKERPLDPDNLDETLRRLLLTTGIAAIGAAFSSLSDEWKRSFCLISMILFLEHKPSLRATICRDAGDDEEAVRITFAYLEFNEDLHTKVDLGGKIFVSVTYLINNWARKVKEKEDSLPGFQKEIDTIRKTLRQGEWITSLSYMIQRTLDTIKDNSEVIMGGLDKILAERPFVLESLKRVFGNLKLETVERYLEARTINAYLITFRSDGGTVARLLNCMASAYKQPALEAKGISVNIDGLQKYNYKQYTDNGRIGVVPKGLTFEQFQEIFQEDFAKVVEFRRELCPKRPKTGKIKEETEFYWDWDARDLENIELILHRFGLSGRNYYGFISEGITQAYAIVKIRELFAGILDPHELYVLINYEKDEPSIIEAVMEGPITELIADQITLSPVESRVLKRKNGQLRAEIFEALGFTNGKELGRHLLEREAQRLEQATEIAGNILIQRLVGAAPEFDDNRCRMIAGTYLATLKAIAGLT